MIRVGLIDVSSADSTGYRVSFSTSHGQRYIHTKRFPMTPEGYDRASRLAHRVKAFIDDRCVSALDMSQWDVDSIYGSKANCA